MRLSLIVTTYNWKEALAVVLASALRQSVLPDEIIIADDGSSDGTGEMLRELAACSPVPIIHSWQEDQGFRAARSRNLAIAASRGDYLVMIDGDMLLERHFIEDHRAFARRGCFVQGSRVLLDEDRSREFLAGGEAILPHAFASGVGNRKNRLRLPWLARLLARTGRGLSGIRTCNFAVWRDDALAVNGFNEDFTGWGREDSEFAARLLNSGLTRLNLRFAAVACHLYHPERPRTELSVNDRLLASTIAEKKIRCVSGIGRV